MFVAVEGTVHSSVDVVIGDSPPKESAIVFPVPTPPFVDLAVAISATSVQDVPSQYSVFAPSGAGFSPPENTANVCTPDASPCPLPLLSSAISVQEEPSHDSTLLPAAGAGLPPTARPAVFVEPVALGPAHPVLSSAIFVQPEPFHSSTKAELPPGLGGTAGFLFPPTSKPDVLVPTPPDKE